MIDTNTLFYTFSLSLVVLQSFLLGRAYQLIQEMKQDTEQYSKELRKS